MCYNRFRYYSPDTGTYISQDPIGLASGEPNFYAYVRDSNSWTDPFGLTGIVYLRTWVEDGVTKSYVGKSKSPEAFNRRKSSHNSKLRKKLGQKGNSKIKYDFEILEDNIVGKDNLAFREETNIRKKGGLDALENKISGMNDTKFNDMGGDIDKKGKKISCSG
ncbi:RHS repeat-associated core domain-containing protein [Cellulophaga sp. 20_2_10]|nr:RHS repeat-associated core domain-containing protein [Cellulophaga sp. 20_2_10]